MGNDNSKQGTPQPFGQNIDKNKLDVTIKQIYFTAQLNKDRRKGQQNTREKELLALIREPTNKRSKDNEYAKAQALANDVKNVTAHEYVMRYADIIKDNQTVISLSKGDTNKILDLIPYVESLIWGCHKCNIQCVDQFENFLLASFGPETQAQLLEFKQVTPELKQLFDSILPSEREVKLYLIDFCNRNGITLETMQEVGHSLSPTELSDIPDPSTKPPHDNQQPQNPYNPGNFPHNYPNNYPQGGGGGGINFPQYNYPQQGGSYPQFVGYPHGNLPNNPHQPGFPNQQGQSGFPNHQGGPFEGGAKNMQSQAPEGNENVKNISNVQGTHQSSDINKGTQTSAAYPDFQRFSHAPTQAGGVKGADDLDDLDAKLKNIRNGL